MWILSQKLLAVYRQLNWQRRWYVSSIECMQKIVDVGKNSSQFHFALSQLEAR